MIIESIDFAQCKQYCIGAADITWKHGEFTLITDVPNYQDVDQVFPLHPEHQFFFDEIHTQEYKSTRVLDIGTGSGILDIAAVKLGAKKVTSLELNPRAKAFAQHNLRNAGCSELVEIRQGSKDIWSPVNKETFDHIISNPPFEPTPPGIEYYTHSSAGKYGTDIVERILQRLDEHLTPNGTAQIVTFSPGDEQAPTFDVIGHHGRLLPARLFDNYQQPTAALA